MKNEKDKKHRQRLMLEGNHGVSFHLYIPEKEKIAIKRYELICLNNQKNCEIVKASHKTDHRFEICLNERQARAVISFEQQENTSHIQDSVYKQKILQGIVILVWQEYRAGSTLHFLWIDCGSGSCKNICLDAYGYEIDDVAVLFNMIFAAMAQGIPQIANTKLLNFDQDCESKNELEIQK